MLALVPILVAVLALAAPVTAPGAHPGPPVYVEVDIRDAEVVFRFTGEQATLSRWLGRAEPDEPLTAPMGDADVRAVRDAVRRLFEELDAVTIDGVRPAFVVSGIEVPPDEVTGYGLPALRFELVCAVAATPRRIDLVWKLWERLEWFSAVKLPVVFRAFGDAQLVFVTPEEPGHTWRPAAVTPPRPQVRRIDAPPAPTLPVPLASVGVLALLAAAAPLLWRARVGAGVLATLAASAVLTAWLCRDVAVLEVRDPFRPAVEVPAEPEALQIFEQLLRNVYAAFDARTEGEIYDLLAVSVTPELLDQLYGEIYESLILRGEGGAVCQIERIETVDRDIDVDAAYEPWDIVPEDRRDAPFFRARWNWRVHGVVAHWGHEHRRINAYEASYVVRNDGDGWRLAACEILDHSRIDSDG